MKLSGHVGFDSLPDQLVNKSVNKGFDFNILCVGETFLSEVVESRRPPVREVDILPLFSQGETGIGKSTIMDSLFKTTFESKTGI